jgi:hypothetical protein
MVVELMRLSGCVTLLVGELVPKNLFSRSLRGMTPKACDQPMPFGVDLLTSQDIAAGHAGETPRR